MREMDNNIIRSAQKFAARWGFLTRDLFFEFFCHRQRTQKFHYWKQLADSGLFVKSKHNNEVLFLSKKSRSVLGSESRPSRFHAFVDHDSIIAEVLLTLERYDLVRQYWLEDELIRDPALAYMVLGADKIYRVPDLVFDLKTPSGQVRCVLEIEKTFKTTARYAKMALAYSDYSHIDLVLFGCENPYIERSITRSFSTSFGAGPSVVPGTFLYEDFQKSELSAVVKFGDKEFSLEKMLQILTKHPVRKSNSKLDLNRTAVRFRNPQNKEAA